MKMINVIFIFILIILFYLFVQSDQEFFVPIEVLTEYKHLEKNIGFLEKVILFLEQIDVKYWATRETLLGAVRDHGMTTWNISSDICIMASEIEKIKNNIKKLNDNSIEFVYTELFGYTFYDLNMRSVDMSVNVSVNVFVMGRQNNLIVYEHQKAQKMWPTEYYLFDEVFPLKKIQYEYYQIYVPNNQVAFLNRVYKGWNLNGVKTHNYLEKKQIDPIKFQIVHDLNKKPYLWVYWDTLKGELPSLIKLCNESVKKNCSKSFDVVFLNVNNIQQFLPEITEYKEHIDRLQIEHKVDLYRIMLLYKYGGLYIDADTIVLKDPIEIMKKLDHYDYVGFGCTGTLCKNGYMKPSNGILASRPNTYLMGHVLMNILEKIKNAKKFEYFELGKHIIWTELSKIEGYKYYHYDNKYDGTRDKYGQWVTTQKIFSNQPIEYENEQQMIFFTLYNSELNEKIKKMSTNELLSKGWNVSKFFKKSLNM